MKQTLAALLLILTLLAAPGVAGIVASLLFAALRQRFPQLASAPTARWRRWLLTLLYTPGWVQPAVFLLAFVIGTIAQADIAWISGQPVQPTLDAAFAGLVAIVTSQLKHYLLPADDGTNALSTGVYQGIALRDRAAELRSKGYK